MNAASPKAAEAHAAGNLGGAVLDPGAVVPQKPEASSLASVSARHVFARESDYWTVTFERRTVRLRDRKGLRYIARLLAAPGQEIHVLDLAATPGKVSARSTSELDPGLRSASYGDAGPLLDATAKDAYRRRLTEIEEDIEDAEAVEDAERSAQAGAEREFLLRELVRAVGLGGRDRRAGSASERARASVTRAIREAITRIGEHHPSLGTHLDRAIRTGTYCAYLPVTRLAVPWTV